MLIMYVQWYCKALFIATDTTQLTQFSIPVRGISK